MASQRAFYSIVQYCPDRFRAEAVNIGLVLLCLEPHGVRAKTTSNYSRVRKLFAASGADLKDIKLSVQWFTERIEQSAEEFLTEKDLANFAASRANDLRLTEPRLAKIENIDVDFDRLFTKLVEERVTTAVLATVSPAVVLPPNLNEVISRLSQSGRVWDPKPFRVPISKRKLDVPYAFRNGVVNYIAPEVFTPGKRSEGRAATLAVDGQFIQRHGVDGEAAKLIVVSTQENEKQRREIDDHVEPVFREMGVRLIRPHNAEAFAREVEASAH